MPQTQSDFLQQFLASTDVREFKPSAPVKYEPTKLDKILAPLTLSERVSAAFVKSILDDSTFTENMQAWVDYGDIVREQLPDAPKGVQTGLGFLASIVGDPITWTGIGALTKTGKAAKLTGKAAETTLKQVGKGERALMTFAGQPIIKGEPVFKIAEKVGNKLEGTRLVTAFKRAFVSPTGHPVTDDLLRDSNDLRRFLTDADGTGWIWNYAKSAEEFDKLLKTGGISVKTRGAAHQLLRRELERPGSIADPLVRDTANKLRALQDDVRKTEFDVGLAGKDFEGDVEYWATIATPDFQKWLNQNFFGSGGSGSRRWSTRHASMLNRQLADTKILPDSPAGSLDQYQAWAKSIGYDGEAFITDPFITGAIRAQRAARAVANQHFIDQTLAKVPGIETFDLGSKYVQKNGRWTKAAEGVSGTTAVKQALRGNLDKGAWVDKGSLYRIVNSDQINAPALKRELKAALDETDGDFVSALQINDILERMGKDGDLLKKLPTITKNGIKVRVMPREVAEELGRVNTRLRDGGAENALLGVFDQGQNIWKAYTLSLFPAYHFRNVVSNVWNNWLSGVDTFAVQGNPYTASTLLQRTMKRSNGKVGDLAGSTIAGVKGIDDATLIRAAQRNGVLGEGFYGADIPTEILDVFKPGASASTQEKVLRTIKGNKALTKSRAVGTYFENNARLANFIDGVRKGMDAGGNFDDVVKAAALRVKKTLFDYRDLTPFEQNVMKRVFPFWTWTAKNIPLQVKMTFQEPGKIVSLDKARRNIEGAEFGGPKGDIRGIAEWMMLQYPMRLFKDKDGVERIGTLGGFIPTGDLLRMADPLNELWAMSTPFLKEPTAQIMNYDPFFRSVIEQYPGQAGKFIGLNMSNRMKHVLRNIRILNEADRIIDTLDPRTLGNLRTGESLVRFFTGFRLYPQDPVKGMAYYEYELQKSIGSRKSAIRKLERQAAQGRIDAKLYQKELTKLLGQIEELENRPMKIPE